MRAFDEPRPRPVPATRELWPAIRNVYAGMSPAARRTYRSILWATIRRRSAGYELGALLLASGAIE